MRHNDLPRDRQAQPKAPLPGNPGLVEAGEALEDTLTIGCRDPGPIISNSENRVAIVGSKAQRHGGPSMAHGVVDEVANHLAEAVGITSDPASRDAPDIHPQAHPLPGSAGLPEEEFVEIDRPVAGNGCPFIETCKGE